MQFDQLLAALTDERYEILKRSVELGKWPDGRSLTSEEKAMSLQVLITYDSRHKTAEQRIGYVPQPDKTDCDHDEPASSTGKLIVKG